MAKRVRDWDEFFFRLSLAGAWFVMGLIAGVAFDQFQHGWGW